MPAHFKEPDLVLLKIAIKEKEKDLWKYRKEFNIFTPILIDENGSVAKAYGIWSHPVSFFINREGKIVGRKFGESDWTSTEMKNLIQQLITQG